MSSATPEFHADPTSRGTRTHVVRALWRGIDPRVCAVPLVLGLLASACSDRLSLDNPGHHITPAPPPLPTNHPTISLVGAVPNENQLRIDWRARASASELPLLAAFVGTDRVTLYDGTPTELDVTQSAAIIGGLSDATDYFVGLGVRAQVLDPWRPSGAVLRFRTGAPTYVDLSALTNGDGTSPSTPTTDLVLALFTAFVLGGGNVWVARGEVDVGTLPLFTGVHLYGGFDPTFLLGQRNLELARTTVTATANEIARLQAGGNGPAIMDGFTLTGDFTVASAVDDPALPLELRGLEISGCARGIKLRASPVGPPVPVVIAGVTVTTSLLEGLSVDGAFDIVIEGSTFDSNTNEGADFNHLVAPEGGSASLFVRGSSFTRNGTEGLDCHLGAPPGAGTGGGLFRIDVEDCDFEANVLDGLRVDIDYELHPTWAAEIVVRGCRARANGSAGVHFDLDARCSAVAHRLACTTNGQAGFLVTSESFGGMCTLSASSLVGNFGPGALASIGNFGISAGHCLFSGNGDGGFVSNLVPSIAHSSVAYLQSSPWTGVTAHDCVVQDSVDPSPFLHAPREFGQIVGFTADGITLTAMPMMAAGSVVEVQDEGIARTVTGIVGASLVLDPVPPNQPTPARALFFGRAEGVTEDWRLSAASIAIGAGMVPPGSPERDAGVFAAPLGGVPGQDDPVPSNLFRVSDTTPAWSTGLAQHAALDISFVDGEPSASSIGSSVVARNSGGAPFVVGVSVVAGRLHVVPPLSGWLTGDVLEIHASLVSTTGNPLAIPLALPLR